jgi:hypothetical protein
MVQMERRGQSLGISSADGIRLLDIDRVRPLVALGHLNDLLRYRQEDSFPDQLDQFEILK